MSPFWKYYNDKMIYFNEISEDEITLSIWNQPISFQF